MPDYNKFDRRVDGLVVETKTLWAADVGGLSEADRDWLAEALHREPQKAAKIEYERAHTGFTRIITVTLKDIERLYQERVAG